MVNKGYSPLVVGSDINEVLKIENRPYGKEKIDYIDNSAIVVGVENEYLFMSGSKNKPTFLVPTGLGESLYTQMFPDGKILKINL